MSARDDILTGLRASADSTVGDATPEQILDAYKAEVLREAAEGFESRVPPVTAGPLTDRDRGLKYAASELRRMADAVEDGAA